MTTRRARLDDALSARIVSRRELHYHAGADPSLDRPAHVRAGSGLAWLDLPGGPRLIVAQDDASFLGVLDPLTGHVEAITLDHHDRGARQFDARRGNKKKKLDLEACCAITIGERSLVLAFGSGSLPVREHVTVLESRAGALQARVVSASTLYQRFRDEPRFSGSELNIEGAALTGSRVLFFQRGNGAPRDGRSPVDATVSVDAEELIRYLDDPSRPPPELRDVVQWDLGSIDGVRLTFTDACALGEDRVLYLAAAEDSPDVIEDGAVKGVAVGVIEDDGARHTTVLDAGGAPFLGKAEGISLAAGRAPAAWPLRAWIVIDRDDPDAASELCELEIAGIPGNA